MMDNHMKTFSHIAILCAVSAGLISCGKVSDLTPKTAVKPADGTQADIKKPLSNDKTAIAQERPTLEQMTTPRTQAVPANNAELLKRSEPRSDDPFDLPPGNEGNVGKLADDKNHKVKTPNAKKSKPE